MHSIVAKYPGVETVFVMVGKGGVYPRPTALQTVLGSCVSVTFHVPDQKVGGFFHALMPTINGYERSLDAHNPYRFVDLAVDAVATELSRLRIRAGQVECKVFGGANAMFQESMGLGRKNVEIAFQELEKRGFKVVGSSVGGTTGRKLVFLTHTGEVFMRFVRKREPA